jgi:3-oxoadipate enol-lactonase
VVGQTDAVRMYWEKHGEGPPLLYFNGTGGDLRKKPNVFDWPLVRHFEVLAHDQRGLGRSDKPDVAYTMADYADDGATLLDEVGWSTCRVVGVSFGGMVAQEFALRHPERVERLVLCCTSTGGAGGASYPLHELADLPVDERILTMIGLSDSRCDESWRTANAAELDAMMAFQRVAAAVGATEKDHDRGARRQLEARRGHDTYDRLPGLDIPTLVCAGRYDEIAPLRNCEALAGRIPGARLEVFEGGHLFMLDDDRAWPTIISFLRGD